MSNYKDSYGDEESFILPDYLGSRYEKDAGNFMVLDGATGEMLTRKFTILFVDSKQGYFVEAKSTNQGIKFIAHPNPNLQIIKTEEFYEEIEEE